MKTYEKYLNEKYDTTYDQVMKICHKKLKDAYDTAKDAKNRKATNKNEKQKAGNIMRLIDKAMEEVLK